MKVAFFFTYGYSIKTWNDSGTLKRELKILELLSLKYGYEFTLYTYGDLNDLNLIKRYYDFEVVPIYSLVKKNKYRSVNFLKSLFYPFILKEDFKKFDLVHQHQLQGVWVTLLIRLLYKIPLIVRTGYDVYTFAKYEQKSNLKIFIYKVLTYLALKFSDLYTVTSSTDFEMLSKNFKFEKNKLKIRPNHIDVLEKIPDFHKRSRNRILSVGRLVEQKNFKVLINEFANTNEILEIDIVGSGKLKKHLSELAKQNNVHLNFLGNCSHEELMELYKNYRYYVSTSTFEGNPKTILEAMSCGCIVLVSNIKNHSELVENKIDGFLFDLDNPNLIDVISHLNNNNILSRKISNNAVKRVTNKNSIETIAKKIDRDYRSYLQT